MTSPARSRAIVVVIAFSAMLSSLQFTLIVPALPEIPRVLEVSPASASWLITVTLLASTVTTPVLSRLADIFGRRKLMFLSLGFLLFGSIIAALGMTFPMVIIGRSLQGFASAVVPIGVSLIHAHVPPKQANSGVALLSGTIGFGSALGLPLSGILLEWTGLSGIFWASGIGAAIFLLLIWALVPETHVRLNTTLDPYSSVLLAIWLIAVSLAVSKGADWGWLSGKFLVSTIVGIITFVLWLAVSRRKTNAVINVWLAAQPRMVLINIATFLTTFGMFTNHLVTMQEARAPIETNYGLNVPVATAGLVLLPFALTMITLTPVTSWSINRFGPQMVLMIGATAMAAGFAFRTVVHGALALTILGSIIAAIGVAFSFAAMPALVNEASPPAELASANGVNALIRTFAGAIASSVFALMFAVFPAAEDPLFLSELGFMLSLGSVSCLCLVAAFLVRPQMRRG